MSDSRDACPSGYRIPTDNEFTALLKNTSRITTVDGQNGRWCSGDLEFSSANPAIFIPLETQDGHSLEYWTSFGTYRNPYCFDGEKTYIQDPGTGCHVRCVKGVDNRKYEVPGAAGKYNDTEFDCVEMSGMIWAPFDCEGTFSYEEAMLACPSGYRLPLREEFEALQSSFSGSYYGVQGCWLGTSPVYDDHLSALFFPKSSDSYWVAGKNKSGLHTMVSSQWIMVDLLLIFQDFCRLLGMNVLHTRKQMRVRFVCLLRKAQLNYLTTVLSISA